MGKIELAESASLKRDNRFSGSPYAFHLGGQLEYGLQYSCIVNPFVIKLKGSIPQTVAGAADPQR